MKANGYATGPATLRTVRITVVSHTDCPSALRKRDVEKRWKLVTSIVLFSFQEKLSERSNAKLTMSFQKLPLGMSPLWNGHPSMLASHQRTGASSSVKPKALATSSFYSPR